MHKYDAQGLPYFISSSGVMQFREVCYTVVSYAPYILLQIYTITNLATFWVTIFDFFTPWAQAYDGSKAVLLLWIIYVISVLCLLCFYARLFIDALWSPAGIVLTSWLSSVMSNREVVAFPLVYWVKCDVCIIS